jgi:hypothetical protein
MAQTHELKGAAPPRQRPARHLLQRHDIGFADGQGRSLLDDPRYPPRDIPGDQPQTTII